MRGDRVKTLWRLQCGKEGVAMGASPRELVGVGLYTTAEVAHLLKVQPYKVRRWIEGYYLYDHGQLRRRASAVISAELAKDGGPRILTFVNLVELHLVKLFRDANVGMRTIRQAAQVASQVFGTDHPFALKRFDTDGRQVFMTLTNAETQSDIVEDATTAQRVFEHMIRPFFLKLDDEQDEIQRFWPLGKHRRVVLDPRRALGQPIDVETGVPAFVLAMAAQAEGSADRAAVMYRVPIEAVRHAIEFERSLAA